MPSMGGMHTRVAASRRMKRSALTEGPQIDLRRKSVWGEQQKAKKKAKQEKKRKG